MEITAKVADGEQFAVEFDIGDTLEAATELFGDAVVYNQYKAGIVVSTQARIRTLIKADKSEEEIQANLSEWRPDVRTKGKTKIERIQDLFAKLSPEQRRIELERMMAEI